METNQRRNRALWWATGSLLLVALICLCLWLFYFQFHESTNDAYANGNLIPLNSAISGSVVAFYTDETDLVEQGQLLVELDSTQYHIVYVEELAALAATVLDVLKLQDMVLVAQANKESKRIAFEKTKYDYENRLALLPSQAISNETFIHARDDLSMAESQYKEAEYALQVARDAVGDSLIQHHPLIEEQRAKVRRAYYNLMHCSIYAPATGYVAKRAVDVGLWVTPSTDLLAIIPVDYVWVDANFKETQLKYMRIGQEATIWFDLYGRGIKYKGRVVGIASGSGSVFSIIPPQNATGNWIKIVQRLPVRISLDPEQVKKYPTRLGISAEVNVDISKRDLPILAEAPHCKSVGCTRVFEVSFEEVDQLMDEMIQKQLLAKP